MDNRDWDAPKQPEGYETLFVIAESVVFIRRGKSSKDELRFCKVEAVGLEVGLALRLVPLESHVRSVYTCKGQRNVKRRRQTPPSNAAHQRRADALNSEHIYAKCALAACACYAAPVERMSDMTYTTRRNEPQGQAPSLATRRD